jgi:hypothetical protein
MKMFTVLRTSYLFIFFLTGILYLSHVTSKIRAVAMLLTVVFATIINTKFSGMYMIVHHTKFHLPTSNCSLVINVKPKAKYRLHAAVIFLSCTLQEKRI